MQTWGTWYGVKLSDDVNAIADTWASLACNCGSNSWIKIGLIHAQQVTMQLDGKWIVQPDVIERRQKYVDTT